MAVTIIIYPADGANSFISIADADSIIEASLGYAQWAALSEDNKARWLIYAYEKINVIPTFVPPVDLVGSCLPRANAYLAIYSLSYNLNIVGGEQQVRIDKVGTLTTEYFKNEQLDRLTIDEFPIPVVQCLADYGVEESPNLIGGVGVTRRTR